MFGGLICESSRWVDLSCSGKYQFLSIAAFWGNTLILVALFRESSLRPPSKFLYRNLAISDLLVGGNVEPM